MQLSAGTVPLPQVTIGLALVKGTEFWSGLALVLQIRFRQIPGSINEYLCVCQGGLIFKSWFYAKLVLCMLLSHAMALMDLQFPSVSLYPFSISHLFILYWLGTATF